MFWQVQNLHHHYRAYGAWTFAFIDYWELNFTASLDDPNTQLMADIIDPYNYPEKLQMPKLVINSCMGTWHNVIMLLAHLHTHTKRHSHTHTKRTFTHTHIQSALSTHRLSTLHEHILLHSLCYGSGVRRSALHLFCAPALFQPPPPLFHPSFHAHTVSWTRRRISDARQHALLVGENV